MPASWRGNSKACIVTILGALSAGHTAGAQGMATVGRLEGAALRSDSATIAVNGTRLFYEAVGNGPIVVLVHGGNLDGRMWDPQFLELAREHRVIRYDARGFGRSAAANAPFQAHEDLFALLVALNVQRTSLIGLSMGGRIVLDFALAHPSMVDRLVLAAPALSGWQFAAGDTSWVPDARLARSRGDSIAVTREWLKSDYMKPAMEHPELAARLRELAAANAAYWMELWRHGDLERPASPPALHRTGLLRVPTLLVVGTRDTPDILRIADTLAATMPMLRRVTLADAGHMVNLEQPARFTELVLEFLRP